MFLSSIFNALLIAKEGTNIRRVGHIELALAIQRSLTEAMGG